MNQFIYEFEIILLIVENIVQEASWMLHTYTGKGSSVYRKVSGTDLAQIGWSFSELFHI